MPYDYGYYSVPIVMTYWQTVWAFLCANAAVICTLLGIAWTASSAATLKLISSKHPRLTFSHWMIGILAPLFWVGIGGYTMLQLTGNGLGYIKRKILPPADDGDKKMLDK